MDIDSQHNWLTYSFFLIRNCPHSNPSMFDAVGWANRKGMQRVKCILLQLFSKYHF